MNLHRTLLSAGLVLLLAPMASAHCDTWDGPVVKAAQTALAKGDVNLVLVWVQKSGETEIREAFKRVMEVRKAGGETQKLADQFFFETLVRVHRAGEGAPYAGLKPAGLDMGPAIPAGDKALETGDLKPVWKLLSDAAHTRLHETFEAAMKARSYKPEDVEAGRKAVAAYVIYIHAVEGMFEAATKEGHEGETEHKEAAGASCGHR